MELNPGDKVTFELETVWPGNGPTVCVKFKGSDSLNTIIKSAIQEHKAAPKPLAVGDKVVFKDSNRFSATIREIKAIDGDLAWIRANSEDRGILADISFIERYK